MTHPFLSVSEQKELENIREQMNKAETIEELQVLTKKSFKVLNSSLSTEEDNFEEL